MQRQKQTNSAKQLHRVRKVVEHVLHRDQIEYHAKCSIDAVLGLASRAGMMLGDHFSATGASLVSQDRNEAVHFAIQFNLLSYLAPHHFQRAAQVVDWKTRNLGDEPIGDTRRDLAMHQGILSVTPPTVHQIKPFIKLS